MDVIESTKGNSPRRGWTHRLERSLFSLYDNFILQRANISGLLLRLYLFLDCLQLLALSFFSNGSRQFAGTTLDSWAKSAADTLLLFPWLPDQFFTLFVINCVVLGVLLVVVLLCITSLAIQSYRGIRRPLLCIAFYVLTFTSSVLYLPCLGTAVVALRSNAKRSVMRADHSMDCWSKLYIASFVVSLCSGVVLFLTTAAFKLFVFMHEPNVHDVGAKAGSEYEVSAMLVRTVELALILMLSTGKDTNKQFFAFLEGGSLVLVLLLNIRYSVLYNENSEALVRFVAWAGAWVGVVEMLLQFFDTFASATLGGVVFCGVLIEYMVLGSSPVRSALNLLTSIRGREVTEREAIRRAVAAIDMHKRCITGGNTNETMVACYMKSHAEHCTNSMCPVREICAGGKISPKQRKDEALTGILYCINSTFKQVLLASPEFIAVRLLYVGFLIHYTKNYILAWEINEGTRGSGASIIQRLHVYRYTRLLKTFIGSAKDLAQSSYDSVEPLDITLRIRRSDKACRLIEQNATVYGQFWDTLMDRAPSFERFVALGSAFLETNKRIKAVWEDLTQLCGTIPVRFVALYASYSHEILQDERRALAAQEYLDRPELLIQSDVIFQHMGAGNCVAAVSANVRDMGRIKNFNAALCELTGYTREELRDSHMQKLVPPLYQDMHSRTFAKRCGVMNSGLQVERVVRETFILHKSQYLVPVTLQVVATPNYTNNYCFLVKMKKLACKEEIRGEFYHIVTGVDHVISGLSANLYELFGADINLIRASGVKIDLFLPELETQMEGVAFRTRLCLPSGSTFSSTPNVLASPRKTLRMQEDLALDVTCQFRKLKTDAEGLLLGYHYEFRKYVDRQSDPNLLTGRNEYEPFTPSHRSLHPATEFAFSYARGGFFQYLSSQDSFGYALATPHTAIGVKEDSPNCPSDDVALAKSLPKFYLQLLPQVRKICERLGDTSLLEKIMCHRNYGEEVAVWRVGSKGFVKDEGRTTTYNIGLDLEEWEHAKSNNSLANKNELLMRTAIRNKANMRKLVKSLPVPWVFLRVILICAFVMLLGIATVVAIYVVFSELFDKLTGEIILSYYQINSCQCALISSSMAHQMVLVNEGLLRIENAYPVKASADELFTWTKSYLYSKAEEIRSDMIVLKSSEYEWLTRYYYDSVVTYRYNGSNVVLTDFPLLPAVELVVQQINNIAHYKNRSQFAYNDSEFATLYYNIKNDIPRVMFSVVEWFTNDVEQQYKDQMSSARTVIIVLCCAFGTLICLQTPATYFLNKTVWSQLDIFLKLPSRSCLRMERAANRFVITAQNSHSDADGDLLLTHGQNVDASAEEHNRGGQSHTMNQHGEEDGTGCTRKKKRFRKSLWVRFSFLWRVALAFAVPASVLVMMCVTAFNNYFFMYDMLRLTNYTIRADVMGAAAEDIFRGHFYDPSIPMLTYLTSAKYTAYYNLRQAMMTDELHQFIESKQRFTDGSKEYIDFIRKSMCVSGTDEAFCSDFVANKGYLAVICEVNWLQRYLWLRYTGTRKSNVFNTDEYVRTVKLYHQFIRPGEQYIYQQILREINNATDYNMGVLLGGVGIVLAFAALFMIFIWLPFVAEKKKEMLRLRLLILFIPPGAISKVKALREFFGNVLFRQAV